MDNLLVNGFVDKPDAKMTSGVIRCIRIECHYVRKLPLQLSHLVIKVSVCVLPKPWDSLHTIVNVLSKH